MQWPCEKPAGKEKVQRGPGQSFRGMKVGVGTGGEGLSSASGLYPPFSGSCLYAGSNVKLVKVLEQGDIQRTGYTPRH